MRSRLSFTLIMMIFVVSVTGCSKDSGDQEIQTSEPVEIDISGDTGFYGWDTYTIRNSFVRLDALPDIGGRILGFEILGMQVLWHDVNGEGEVGDFNAGGAYLLPIEESGGSWPPSELSTYETIPYEISMSDSAITMISAGQSGDYRIVSESALGDISTISGITYTLENTGSESRTVAMQHVVSLPVGEDATLYAPVRGNNWKALAGSEDNPQWQGTDNGIFKARYEKQYGVAGLNVSDGWVVWHDDVTDLAYVLRFPAEKGTFPRDYQVEVRSMGAGNGSNGETYEYDDSVARMELAVNGRFAPLDAGDSREMDITWQACRISAIERVLPNAIIAEEPALKDGWFSGKFGIFQGGYIQYAYLDSNKEIFGFRNLFEIGPLNEVVINHSVDTFSFSDNLAYLRIQVVGYDTNVISVISDIPMQ